MSKNLEEIAVTTGVKVNPTLTTQQIASAILDEPEFNSCWDKKISVYFLDTPVTFTSKKILQNIRKVLPPITMSNGDVRIAENISYFKTAQAFGLIAKKFGLTVFSFIGAKPRVTGLLVTSAWSGETDQRAKVYQIDKLLKAKFPKHHFLWNKCEKVISCDVGEFFGKEEMESAET